MQEEKIQTLHPTPGKTNKQVSKVKYDVIKDTMLSVLKDTQLTHTELFTQIHKRLDGKFDGNIDWYSETVKLDLEARKVIARTSDRPQKYKLAS